MLAPSQYRWRFLGLAALFCVLTCAAFQIDMPVARWTNANGFQTLGKLDQVITWSEVFAHGAGVSLLLVLVIVLDPKHRRQAFRIGLLSLGAGGITNVLKLFVTRTRPKHAHLDGDVWSTFANGFPGFRNDHLHSFPSGHTTAAIGLAIGLSWLYPRGRWLFVLFAIAASSQRWSYRAHYVSDSCGGAVVAFLVAAVVLGSSPLERWLTRFENRTPVGENAGQTPRA